MPFGILLFLYAKAFLKILTVLGCQFVQPVACAVLVAPPGRDRLLVGSLHGETPFEVP